MADDDDENEGRRMIVEDGMIVYSVQCTAQFSSVL